MSRSSDTRTAFPSLEMSKYQHGSGQEKVHRRASLGGPFGRHDEGTPDPLTASSWECTALVIHGEKGRKGKVFSIFLAVLGQTHWMGTPCLHMGVEGNCQAL